MQYAVSSEKGKKQWLSLNFRSFGACNSLPFSQLNIEDDKHPLSAQEILKLIDFSLVVKFKNDHQIPHDENFPQDPALRPDYCAKKYGFQILAKIDSPNRCRNRYRLYENWSAQDHFSTDAFC